MQTSQKSNLSFSDLLNYELCTSQKSEHSAPVQPVPTTSPASDKKKSRADDLRTRLRLARYKMKTDQVAKSSVDIISTYEAGASYSSYALNASTSTGITSSAESTASYRVPNITVSSPRREPRFVQASLDPGRPIAGLGMPPVQFAIPKDGAQVSSRMIQDYNLPSSSPSVPLLPQSISPDQLMSPMKEQPSHTARLKRRADHDDADVEQAEAAHQRYQRLKQHSYEAQLGDLASSTVKGSAAEGLLELMTSRR
jgi:hypothetical protein